MALKILMIYSLPSPISPQKNSTLSIIYPGRAAEDAGYEVEFWDSRLDSEKLLWELVRKTDIIAISSLSGFQLGESIQITKKVKKEFPDKPAIWRGVYTWIIGNPGETPAEIMNTLRVSDEIKALHPQGKSRATIYVLMPLPGTIAFDRAKREGWLLPETMNGWTEMSAAYNPKLPRWMNNVYFIAGFHHNRHHKTAQNFPGWWRIIILPFEILIEWRWKMGIKKKNHLFFTFFSLEYFSITKLLTWRSRHSAGQIKATQAPKLLERLFPGLAGH